MFVLFGAADNGEAEEAGDAEGAGESGRMLDCRIGAGAGRPMILSGKGEGLEPSKDRPNRSASLMLSDTSATSSSYLPDKRGE